MANSEEMQEAIIQVAIQTATAVVIAMKRQTGKPKPHTRRSIPEEHHRPRPARPMMSQPAFSWKAPD